MNETAQANPIPESVDTRQSIPNWRIAGGAICRGREEDGTLERRPQIVGSIRRIGVHEGETDDGRAYSQLECELQTAKGLESVHTNLSSMTSSLTFAEGLLMTTRDQVVAIEARSASKKNRYGSYSTYANLFAVGADLKTTPLRPVRNDGDMEVRLKEALKALEKHPNWGARPKRTTEDEEAEAYTPFDDFQSVVKQKGWPDPLGKAKDAYLGIARTIAKRTFASLSEVDDATWAAMIAKAKDAAKPPKVLEPFLSSSIEDFDPFADPE